MKTLIPIAIIIAGLLIAGVLVYTNSSKSPEELLQEGEVLSLQQVAENVINYVNQNILRGEVTDSLVSSMEENGLYKIILNIQGQEIETYASRNGKFFFPEGINITEAEPVVAETGYTIGNFSVSNDEICKENEKPIVYFFGSKSCPYCTWEHPIMEKVAAKFGDNIAFHNNMDIDADMNVFSKYSTGGIPTLVFGCKYYRIGAGTQGAEEEEEKNLTALICNLTGNKPDNICSEVQDLINQI